MSGYLLPFLGGLGTGIVMSFMLGTVFFAIINNSINSGPLSGVLVALGVLISDVVFVSIVLFGSQFIPSMLHYEQEVKWIGGSFVILLGIIQISKQRKVLVQNIIETKKKRAPWLFISEGFFLNALNPVNLVVWGAITAYLTNIYTLNLSQKSYFFIGAILSIFLTESGISLLAHKLKKILNHQRQKQLNYIIAVLFIIFGILMIIR